MSNNEEHEQERIPIHKKSTLIGLSPPDVCDSYRLNLVGRNYSGGSCLFAEIMSPLKPGDEIIVEGHSGNIKLLKKAAWRAKKNVTKTGVGNTFDEAWAHAMEKIGRSLREGSYSSYELNNHFAIKNYSSFYCYVGATLYRRK
ncbi:MAG: hypothetical protein GTN38_04220 [Candidatus Aenigmarchaeota archaeon]|nr:hypothetical protein [Candidatus Aenigmarchaeota archaeon]NIP40868.1 hypothetical protein [Candidatus Aenigmarchaeota archaeon]NIQ17982.1 hypothetical protein [Candidatus Aenigmarchaeota archaeon]NIS73571.1 hypothetical protein [Candidatus Aenigmarchaeota archaeon]